MTEEQAKELATPGHERGDVAVRPIALAAAALVGVIAVTFVLMRVLLAALDARPGPTASPLAAGYGRTAPPEPRLQTSPREDLQRLRAAEDVQLQGYGWTDRQAGIVHIPIARAMGLLAERGR